MDRIEIRDRYNKNRLLGTLPMMPFPRARYYQLATMPPLATPCCIDPYDNPFAYSRSEIITFELEQFDMDGGWTRRFCFVTDVSLDKLRNISGFRYPGETDRQAEARRYYS